MLITDLSLPKLKPETPQIKQKILNFSSLYSHRKITQAGIHTLLRGLFCLQISEQELHETEELVGKKSNKHIRS